MQILSIVITLGPHGPGDQDTGEKTITWSRGTGLAISDGELYPRDLRFLDALLPAIAAHGVGSLPPPQPRKEHDHGRE